MGSLQDRTAVITGGTSGIGLAIVRRFAAEGAQVIVTGRRQAELDAAVKAIRSGAIGVRANSADLSDLDRLIDRVGQLARPISVLVANAGGGSFLALGEITPEQYEDTFGRNVKGGFTRSSQHRKGGWHGGTAAVGSVFAGQVEVAGATGGCIAGGTAAVLGVDLDRDVERGRGDGSGRIAAGRVAMVPGLWRDGAVAPGAVREAPLRAVSLVC
ncbi:SDR family NAD(P)-dependent oxidoreductase (plasmid) [Roseomonas sp. CCTCC AB2023176]|uniref:SDR family NAD(P)-dependent oxidoreductase n=1 Tax=Roseomonas sp. CCTCC AB2023176 TaxID=3342640 RepID=UPI0035DFD2C7